MKLNNNRLQLAMANACMSINELAAKSEVSRISIGKCIKGSTEPRPATIGKIAKALNVRAEDLIETGATTPTETV